jgi:hypothetical protein
MRKVLAREETAELDDLQAREPVKTSPGRPPLSPPERSRVGRGGSAETLPRRRPPAPAPRGGSLLEPVVVRSVVALGSPHRRRYRPSPPDAHRRRWLPLARVEGGERGLDRDLHRPAAAVAGSGRRVDRTMANHEQGPTPVASRSTIRSTDPATPPSLGSTRRRPPSPEYESAGEQVPTCNASNDGGSARFRRTHRRAA